MLIRMGYAVRALAVAVPILYQWQTEVRTATNVWKPHPITAGLGGVVHRYLNLIMLGQEVIVTVNGKEIGRFVPKDAIDSYLTDSLTGILKEGYELNEERMKRLSQKYGSIG